MSKLFQISEQTIVTVQASLSRAIVSLHEGKNAQVLVELNQCKRILANVAQGQSTDIYSAPYQYATPRD